MRLLWVRFRQVVKGSSHHRSQQWWSFLSRNKGRTTYNLPSSERTREIFKSYLLYMQTVLARRYLGLL
jgi:hypothetical protein